MKSQTMSLDEAADTIFGKMTTPESEDWNVIANGDDVHLIAMREEPDKRVHFKAGITHLADFKQCIEDLPVDHSLGLVNLMMPSDYESCGGMDLYLWLLQRAKTKNFSLITTHGPVTTAKAIEARVQLTIRFT